VSRENSMNSTKVTYHLRIEITCDLEREEGETPEAVLLWARRPGIRHRFEKDVLRALSTLGEVDVEVMDTELTPGTVRD
jgi:hypothetical protein